MNIDVGIIAGAIGAITGPIGLIMGYTAYRRSNEVKKSDRRLNLHVMANEVRIAANELRDDLLPRALPSRHALMEACGRSRSGLMQEYTQGHSKDSKHAVELSKQIPSDDVNYNSMSLYQLERELVCLDKLKGLISQLASKYRCQIQQDKEDLGRELAKHPHP